MFYIYNRRRVTKLSICCSVIFVLTYFLVLVLVAVFEIFFSFSFVLVFIIFSF